MKRLIVLCATLAAVVGCVGCSEDDGMSDHEKYEITYYAPDGSKELFYIMDYFVNGDMIYGVTCDGRKVQVSFSGSTIREMSSEERMLH